MKRRIVVLLCCICLLAAMITPGDAQNSDEELAFKLQPFSQSVTDNGFAYWFSAKVNDEADAVYSWKLKKPAETDWSSVSWFSGCVEDAENGSLVIYQVQAEELVDAGICWVCCFATVDGQTIQSNAVLLLDARTPDQDETEQTVETSESEAVSTMETEVVPVPEPVVQTPAPVVTPAPQPEPTPVPEPEPEPELEPEPEPTPEPEPKAEQEITPEPVIEPDSTLEPEPVPEPKPTAAPYQTEPDTKPFEQTPEAEDEHISVISTDPAEPEAPESEPIAEAVLSEGRCSLVIINTVEGETDSDQMFLFEVLDQSGQPVRQQAITGSGRANLSGLTPGEYIVQVRSNWSWQYRAMVDSQPVTLSEEHKTEAAFTMRCEVNQWASGNDTVVNSFLAPKT